MSQKVPVCLIWDRCGSTLEAALAVCGELNIENEKSRNAAHDHAIINRTYAVGVFSLRQSGALSSFCCSFFALRAKKRTTDEIGSTMLPQQSSV
jgi:hypothetical protein